MVRGPTLGATSMSMGVLRRLQGARVPSKPESSHPGLPQGGNATPTVAGDSKASALISAFTGCGKDPGPSAPNRLLQVVQMLLEDPSTPAGCHFRPGMEPAAAIPTFAHPSAANGAILARTAAAVDIYTDA